MRYLNGVLILGALALASPAVSENRIEHGFLRLQASTTLLKNSEAVDVQVGLFAGKGDKPSQKVWFYGQFSKRLWSEPQRFRWTDSERCPAALVALRQVRSVEMPKVLLPIPDPEGREGPGSIFLDGRIYDLSVSSSALNGQWVGEAHLSSNLETELAAWAEKFLAALRPCWSTTVPEGVDSWKGSMDEALANPPAKPHP
jgi:hypothetical protein